MFSPAMFIQPNDLFVSKAGSYPSESTIQVLPSKISSWPCLQTLDYVRKVCHEKPSSLLCPYISYGENKVLWKWSLEIKICPIFLFYKWKRFICMSPTNLFDFKRNHRYLKKSRLLKFCHVRATSAASSKGIFAAVTDSTNQKNKAGDTYH